MRLVTLCAALLIAATSTFAQTETNTHAPKLVCDAPEFDFGTQDNAQTVEHTFVLRNAGDLTLEIANARPGCGCTVASISQRSVPPGGESRITTRLSLAGRNGAQHKTITVESNDPTQPQYTLVLKGVAGAAITVQPPQLIQGQALAGTQPTSQVEITSMGTPFQVSSVEANSDQFTARVETIQTGLVYRLYVAPVAPLAAGQLNASIIIRTDHPQRPVIEVPVAYVAMGQMVVAPREIVFSAPSQDAVSRSLLVRSGNGAPFQLTAVEPPRPDVGVSIESLGGNGYRVTLTNLVANAELSGTIVKIRSDIAGAPEMDVPVRVLTPAAPGS